MSVRSLAIPVLCRECHKRLRGREGVVPNRYHVRKHKRLDTGFVCNGHLFTDHKEASTEGWTDA